MLGKMRRLLKKEAGFTLIELMTVLIILGVILGIGVPKYMELQRQAKIDADVITLKNILRAAETYAASINDYDGFTIKKLSDAGIIDAKDWNKEWGTLEVTIEFDESAGRISGLGDKTIGDNESIDDLVRKFLEGDTGD